MYVLDSHGLIFYLLGKSPVKVNDILDDENNTFYVPTIVLAEIFYAVKKDKVRLNFDDVIVRIKNDSRYKVSDFNYEVFEQFVEIRGLEMHDRIIVATTKLLGVVLITKDKEIVDSRIVPTIWDS